MADGPPPEPSGPSLSLETLRTRVATLPGVGSLVSALEEGRPAAARGLHGASAALLLAAAAPAAGPTLVVGADPEEADALAEDLSVLCGEPAAVALFPAFGARDPEHRSREDRVIAARIAALESLGGNAVQAPRFLVAPAAAALDGVPSPERLRAAWRRVAPGDRVPPEALAKELDAARFARVARVEAAGEWTLRGGVLDVFPLGRGGPVRVEWYGDEVASVRRFDPAAQRSLSEEGAGLSLDLLPRGEIAGRGEVPILAHLPPGAWVVLREPDRIGEWVRRAWRRSGSASRRPSPAARSSASPPRRPGTPAAPTLPCGLRPSSTPPATRVASARSLRACCGGTGSSSSSRATARRSTASGRSSAGSPSRRPTSPGSSCARAP